MTRRPKILMLTTQLGYGGAETSFIRLANFLAQSMEVTVALFTADYGSGSYTAEHEPLNASIILLDQPKPCGRFRRWWHRIRQLRALKRKHDVTISFLAGPNLVNVLSGSNASTIISLRGSRQYDPVAPKLQRLLFQYLIDPIVFHLAACIVPVSAGLKNEIRNAAGAKVLDKVCVISPFVEVEKLQHRLAEAPPEIYRSLRDKKVIVAVGRLSVEKGFQDLIRVFSALAKIQPGVKLLLVGDGPMLQELRVTCTTLDLPVDNTTPGVTSVLFAGYQKNALSFMALGRVYAMTSATEGFPSVILEAMAAGLPVIAADTPWGVRAILRDGDDSGTEPYPTTQATPTDYGMLMPRIDLREYEAEWVRALMDYLNKPHAPNPKTSSRVRDYDIAVVGAQWHQLIQTMVAA